MMDVDSDILLDLRRGDREGFVRYFEVYRAPVYDLVRSLLRDGQDAVSATGDVFTTAYRRILLAEGRIDLRAWTFKAAFDVCDERMEGPKARRGHEGGRVPDGCDAGASLRRETSNAAAGPSRREPHELAVRFVEALEMVTFHQQAVLVLHDISELNPAELAIVFDVSEDAASVLLFRAREAFRRAFEDVSSDRRLSSCRLAEQTAAGEVGGSLSDADLRRLDEHAVYCRDCRRIMQGWERGARGLALCRRSAPLPKGLEAAPVFGTVVPITGAADSAAAAGTIRGVLAWIGHAAAGRAAAYGLAATCLAFAAGLAVVHPWSDQNVIVLSATWLGRPPSVQPASNVGRPPAGPAGPAAKASADAVPSSASGSPEAVELPAEVGSPAGTSETSVAVATDPARPTGRSLTAGGSGPSSPPLAAGEPQKGNARGLDKAKKTKNGAGHSGNSSGGDGGHAQPGPAQRGQSQQHAAVGAKQKPAKAKDQHAQKQDDHPKKTKNH